MTDKLCDRCAYKDSDWFESRTTGTPIHTFYCAANRPQFPSATHCPTFEPTEVLDLD